MATPSFSARLGAGQFIGEMGVVENRPRSATARAASDVEVEIFTPTEFLDQIVASPRSARELIRRLSQRLREADDHIVNDERRSGRAYGTRKDADSQTAIESVNNAYLAAKNPWLQRQFRAPLGLAHLPFVVGRGPVSAEGLPPLWKDMLAGGLSCGLHRIERLMRLQASRRRSERARPHLRGVCSQSQMDC